MNKDLKFFKDNSPSKSYFAVLINPCFYAVILYRLSNFMYRIKIPLIPKVIWFFNRILFNVDIDYRAKIGKKFMLVHGLGVVIGCNAIIGEEVKVYQGVTIGGNNNKERNICGKVVKQPIIGDKVVIYANSMIVGPVKVDSNSVIGAMNFIDKDIINR